MLYRIVNPKSWNMALGGLVLGSLILYLRGMRIMMFQLSGFYCILYCKCSCDYKGMLATSDPCITESVNGKPSATAFSRSSRQPPRFRALRPLGGLRVWGLRFKVTPEPSHPLPLHPAKRLSPS